jgi:hypothetical protein
MKGFQTVRNYATMMATAVAGVIKLGVLLEQFVRCLAFGCRINRRMGRPITHQLLMALDSNP